jgi:cytochrome P450
VSGLLDRESRGLLGPHEYADVVEALGRPERFSSARRDDAGGPGSSVSIPKRPSLEQRPLELDPPTSTPYRKILRSLLSPAAFDRMREAVRARVAWCVDQFIGRGAADLGDEFASAVPASFTIDWLGLPRESWPTIATTMHNVTSQQPGSPRHQEALANLQQMFVDLSAAIAERREPPRDDVISHILLQQIEDDPISDEEALSMVALIVAGGVDTVAALASQAFIWLSENRDDHARAENRSGDFDPGAFRVKPERRDPEAPSALRRGDRELSEGACATRRRGGSPRRSDSRSQQC